MDVEYVKSLTRPCVTSIFTRRRIVFVLVRECSSPPAYKQHVLLFVGAKTARLGAKDGGARHRWRVRFQAITQPASNFCVSDLSHRCVFDGSTYR